MTIGLALPTNYLTLSFPGAITKLRVRYIPITARQDTAAITIHAEGHTNT